MQGAASSVQYSDAVTGSNFYVARVPEILDVPGSSLIAAVSGINSGNYFYSSDAPYFAVQEVPEPATFALFGVALLVLCWVGLRPARASATRLFR